MTAPAAMIRPSGCVGKGILGPGGVSGEYRLLRRGARDSWHPCRRIAGRKRLRQHMVKSSAAVARLVSKSQAVQNTSKIGIGAPRAHLNPYPRFHSEMVESSKARPSVAHMVHPVNFSDTVDPVGAGRARFVIWIP
jgi:hypothetical protein